MTYCIDIIISINKYQVKRIMKANHFNHELPLRHLLEIERGVELITAMEAVAAGHALFPSCGTILDIGGQDTRVIRLNGEGAVSNCVWELGRN